MLRLGWAEVFVFERLLHGWGLQCDVEAGASDLGLDPVGAAGDFTSRGRKNYARGVCRLRIMGLLPGRLPASLRTRLGNAEPSRSPAARSFQRVEGRAPTLTRG